MSLEALVPYCDGGYFATAALKGRLAKLGQEGRAAVHQVSNHQNMVTEFREALHKTVELEL